LNKFDLYQNFHLKNLGPEPLENKFNSKYFKEYIFGRNRTIKDILMDQKFVSGLGNIYVNEILFFSCIKPTRKIKYLSDSEINKVIKFTKKILSKAITLGGSSIKDFSSSSGKKGLFQQEFRVYGRKGEFCRKTKCKSKIVKIVLANRASFFCDKCQK
jgi:formamidopyrimidine-DNA glycosylase